MFLLVIVIVVCCSVCYCLLLFVRYCYCCLLLCFVVVCLFWLCCCCCSLLFIVVVHCRSLLLFGIVSVITKGTRTRSRRRQQCFSFVITPSMCKRPTGHYRSQPAGVFVAVVCTCFFICLFMLVCLFLFVVVDVDVASVVVAFLLSCDDMFVV